MDTWEPGAVLEAMATDGVATGGGPPFFLISLLNHPDFDPAVHLPYMDRLVMGGAPVPTAVVQRATDLGITLIRAYGSTEHPSTTASLQSDPLEKRIHTDGRIISGSEIRLLDSAGSPVAVGEPGEIRSRGPELFAGYIDPALTADAIDPTGWYDTGDIGVLDPDGYLTITDRKKDIIIRGGENISSAEVEGVLAEMAGVAEIAVVAAPDARYGEHGTAVIRLLPGAPVFGLEAARHAPGGGRAGPSEVARGAALRRGLPTDARRGRSRRTCCVPRCGSAGDRTSPSRSRRRGLADPGGCGGGSHRPMVQNLGGC